MSKADTNDNKNKQTNNIQQTIYRSNPKVSMSSKVSTATFSSISKQAEKLVNGSNSVLFNSYNNYLVFKWISMNINDSLSIDIINRMLLNVASLKFASGGEIVGISDGFTVNKKGQIVQIYDPTIALSCAFGYKIQTETDNIAGRLNIEIERRQLDYDMLLNKYKETDENAKHAESMIHYIDYDLDNHTMNFIIPIPDETGELGYGDTLPANTIEYGEIVPGEYDPSVGINKVDKSNWIDKLVMNISKDGCIIDGDISISGDMMINNKMLVQTDQTTINNSTAVNGIVYASGGFQYPMYEVTIESETGESITISYPEQLILGIATAVDLPVDFVLPSSKAVYDYVSAVTKAMMEVIAADFEAKQQLIDLNAHMIDGIKNSCGGYETEIDEYCEGSTDWRLWVFLRRWIIKGLSDSIQGLNGPEWETNLPSLKDCFDKYGFGPTWQANMSISGSGSEHSIKIGHEETMTRRDVCNLYVDGAASLGLVTGKDSYSGIYDHNWLVVHGYIDYKNSGIHFLCEGVAKFTNTVKFEGSVEGLNYAPIDHTHEYSTLTGLPDIYNKTEIDTKINDISTTVDTKITSLTDDIQALQTQINTLNDKVNELLSTIKDMSTYEDVLFRLIDLTKDIMNINTTLHNYDQRIIALENAKGDIDAVKQQVVDLQSWENTAKQQITDLDTRVTALEGQ